MASCTKRRGIQAVDVISGNDDLLTEILLVLPLKSLVRFKAVSTHWRSLITSSSFTQRRNPNPCSATGLFLYPDCSSYQQPPPCHCNKDLLFVPLDNQKSTSTSTAPPVANLHSLIATSCDSPIYFCRSCNGLLLCYTVYGCRQDFYIVNLTTKQYRKLPDPNSKDFVFRRVTLACEPSNSEPTQHYKIICVSPMGTVHGDQVGYQIEIYSSETNAWRPSGKPFNVRSGIYFYRGIFWNGAVNWYSLSGDSLYFNIEQEICRTMPMPPPLVPNDANARRSVTYFGESAGHLHLIQTFESRETEFNLYELERDYSGWLLKCHLDLDKATLPGSPGTFLQGHYHEFTTLCVVRKECKEESFLVLRIDDKVFRYDVKEKTLKKIFDIPAHMDGKTARPTKHHAHQYMENLACL